MAKSSPHTPVSDDMQRVLDHLTGIPPGKTNEAAAIQSAGLGSKPVGTAGMWMGGCYYVRDDNGEVQGRTGRWHRVACMG